MRLQKEGLKQYYVQDDIDNYFFISVEYEMIHQNMLEIFVPMQIREKDGIKMLLYDITEGESLEEALLRKNSGFEECNHLVESVKQLFETIGEFMLQIEHISFSKKEIYLMKDGKIRWMYRPDYSYEVKNDAEEFFAWMLSKIDYNDQLCIRFIYHVYDEIRNKGISKKVIDECLIYGSDLQEKYQKMKFKKENEKKKEEERQKELYLAKQKERTQETEAMTLPDKVENERTKKVKKKNNSFSKEKGVHGLKILCCLGILCSVIIILSVLVTGIKYGFQFDLLKHLAGAACLAGVFCALYKSFVVQEGREKPREQKQYKKRTYAR